MKEPVFTGTATAMVTPFSDGVIDFSALDRLLTLQLKAEIDALVITGTTGEASTLTEQEKASLWSHCVRFTNGGRPVIAGIGTNCTEQSLQLAKLAQDCGIDALLAVTPYYNKCTQEGLVAHYTAIADATELPLIVYNVPSRTGVNLLPETCQKLSKHPRINGIKEASGSLAQLIRTRALCGNQLHIWSGNDELLTAAICAGANGVISVASNIRPKAVRAMAQAALNSDCKTAATMQCRYQPLFDALFCEVNPIPVKAALYSMGLCSDEARAPLSKLSLSSKGALYSALRTCPEL